MNIGTNIAALRKNNGITQEALANELGVSPQAVSKWENSTSCPDVSLLPDIAKYFGVSIDDLLNLNESEIINKNNKKPDSDTIGKSADIVKNLNIKIIQQNGKENNIKIPFKLVKLGLDFASAFGISRNIAEKISLIINSNELSEIFEMDTETGEHIIISLS